MTLLAKSFLGVLLAGTVGGGLTFGGYHLNSFFGGRGVSKLAKSSEFLWEYFLRNGSDVECSKQPNKDDGVSDETTCNTPWAQKVSNDNKDEKSVIWWIIGNEDDVNNMLSQWKESKKDDLKNKNIGEELKIVDNISFSYLKDKCETGKEGKKVEIICRLKNKNS